MKFTKFKYEKPVTGIGTVKVGAKTFSVDLFYKDNKGNETSDHFSFNHSDIPDTMPEGFTLKNGKSYWFNVRSDGSAINNIRPAAGIFTVVCSGIARDDDDAFVVVEKSGDYGKYWQFVANLEVVEGDSEGIIYPLYLPLAGERKRDGGIQMRFGPDDDGNMSPMGDPDKSQNVKRLFDFTISSGLIDVTIPWKEEYSEEEDFQSFLSVLDKAIRRLKVKFVLIVKRGYPETMTSIEGESEDVVDEDVEEDDEEEEVKPTKTKSVVVAGKKKPVVEEDDDEDDAPVARPSFSKLKKK